MEKGDASVRTSSDCRQSDTRAQALNTRAASAESGSPLRLGSL